MVHKLTNPLQVQLKLRFFFAIVYWRISSLRDRKYQKPPETVYSGDFPVLCGAMAVQLLSH